jgi:hypothetical protein
MTVDSATAASQNGFCSYKLPFIRKPIKNYLEHDKKHEIFITFICYRRAVLKQDHCMKHFLSYANTRFVTQPLQNPSLCSSTAWTEFGALSEDGRPFGSGLPKFIIL